MVAWLYTACLLCLAIYGLNSLWLTFLYWFNPRKQNESQPIFALDDELPTVTVQLPMFNERYVAERLLQAVSRLNYPRELLQIQVLDDSTDDTRDIVDKAALRLRLRGFDVTVCRRSEATGFKAGALAAATQTARGEFIAIFDADFLPLPDFLRRTVSCFADPQIGCVQTRWDHVNADYSLFTQLQGAGIDGHFLLEQEVRNRMGWFIGFNGSAGIWRKACIEEAGGWSGDTLTEDLDLSYRAQLAGWRFHFLSDVTVPAEVPAQMDAYKRQQFRWAKGSVQTAKKLLPQLWQARIPLATKFQGTLHLTGYFMHPLIVLVFLLGIPMSVTHSPAFVILPVLTVAMLGPWCLYGTAIAHRSRTPWHGAWLLFMLTVLGAGMSLNNTRAALEALLGIESSFKRTPKFDLRSRADHWSAKRYAVPINGLVLAELAAAGLAFGVILAGYLTKTSQINEWYLVYAGGYGYVALLSLWQSYGRELVRRLALQRRAAR